MPSFIVRGLLVVLCGILGVSGHEFDKPSRIECSKSQTLSHIGSVYSQHFKVRKWSHSCRRSVEGTSCFWTSSQNKWDQPLYYSCPRNHFINGLFSFHHNRFEDGRFSFKCCVVPRKEPRDCYFTDFVNNWHADMDYNVPDGYVIKAVYSLHKNRQDDRIWKFNICRF